MCADCHSTDVRKNYDFATDKFQTRWAEINVGCEACHGPGSRHLEWAGLQLPPLQKGGKGGFKSESEIPLSPPFSKGEKSSKDTLEALASFHQARGASAAAKEYAERLRALQEKRQPASGE